MPTPRPISRQFLRCLAVASRRRGNHSNGADTCLPSAKVTTRESLVKDTLTTSAAGLTPKVHIPRNYKLLAVLFNQNRNAPILNTFGIGPKFTVHPTPWRIRLD